MDVKGRTVRDFQAPANLDVWETADVWAGEHGYSVVGQDASSRLYQKGTNVLVVPQMLWITWTGSAYHLEAWVRAPMFNRIMSLGILPAEMVLEDGGFAGIVPRRKARKEVNEFLAALGVPAIT